MRRLRGVTGALLVVALLVLAAVGSLWRGAGFERVFVPWCCGGLCRALGLRLKVRGAPPEQAALWVANHISWLDVLALKSLAPVAFIAKEQVRGWPLLGALVAAAGTLFVRRSSARKAATLLEVVARKLEAGASVAVFPEGTSTAGEDVLPFKALFFEAAARARVGVQPISIVYPRGAGAPAVAPFIGDDEFLPHLLRVLEASEIHVELTFAPLQQVEGRTRRQLASAAREAVVAGLVPPVATGAAGGAAQIRET